MTKLSTNRSARSHLMFPCRSQWLLRLKWLAPIKNGCGLTLPTLHMHGMCYYYGTRTSIPIAILYTHTAQARTCTPLACFARSPINVILEMCSVSTNGERASPAQQSFQMIGLKILDKHANILEYLPEYQELVHISVHKCIPI